MKEGKKMYSDNQKIYVLKQSGYAINSNKPQEVEVINDTFSCPEIKCTGVVPITYWEDVSGKHPNFGLRCTKCGSAYYILK